MADLTIEIYVQVLLVGVLIGFALGYFHIALSHIFTSWGRVIKSVFR